jgi:hypothetical protein
MFPIAGGRIVMERDADGFRCLKYHRLPDLKILGECDGRATDTEPDQKNECAEWLSHAIFLTEPGRNTKHNPTPYGGNTFFRIKGAKGKEAIRGLRRVCDNEKYDVVNFNTKHVFLRSETDEPFFH